jgi:hypothetical protein
MATPNDLEDADRRRADAIRKAERDRCAAMLLEMAEAADRFAKSAMARLDDLSKAAAFREAAQRIRDLR